MTIPSDTTRSAQSKILDLPGASTVTPGGRRLGFCTGCFDILQSGHAVFFEQCREYCDTLVVIVGRGSNIAGLKPGRPINPDFNRLFLIAALESVDHVTLGDRAYTDGKIDCVDFCDRYSPAVYVVNDDDSALEAKRAFCQTRGIQLQTVTRTVPEFLSPTSTTDIIQKAQLSSGANG